MKKVVAAAIQYEPAMFAHQVNLENLYRLTEKAAKNGANIIVLPEMATTGYGWTNRWELAPYVDTIPGVTTELFSRITRQYGCYVVIGLAELELETGIFYNSAALIGPDGVMGCYRKTHLFVSDPRWAAVGNLGLPVWDTEFGRLGIAICMDLEFPEVARVLALKGAQIIAFPCNWLGETCPSALWMTRAMENGVYIVAANRWGQEREVNFSGGSCVIDSQGTILAYQGNGNGVIQAELVLGSQAATNIPLNEQPSQAWPGEYIRARRPELYRQLMCTGHQWKPETFFSLDKYNPLPPGREALIGVVQFEAIPGNRDNNLSRIKEWVVQAKQQHPHLQLLVFPELANTGMVKNKMGELAEPIPGFTTNFLSKVAMEHSIYLNWGMAEKGEDGQIYLTAVFLGPDGRMNTYKKVHLLPQEEDWARAGSGLPLPIDTPLGRIGLLLGTDLLFPESARCLATQGVDLILVPSSLTGSGPVGLDPSRNLEVCSSKLDDPFHWCIWRIRAWENSVFLAVANKAEKGEGRSGLNLSGIFGPIPYERCEPCQEILTESTEGLLVTPISTSRATREGYKVRVKDNLRRRNTSLYRELVTAGK
jgi:predicted amidohydrolase